MSLDFIILENGARCRTRTGTAYGRGILSPLCLPIPPSGRLRIERDHKRVKL